MEIPQTINNIMQRILESEEEWKALYMASWGAVLNWLEPKYKNTCLWREKLKFSLPASKKKYVEYTPEGLCGFLTSKDMDFTLGHLQTLFSLFEELINELCPLVCGGQEIRAFKFSQLKKFLSGDDQYKNFGIKIDQKDLDELELAKETRNCFIHNDSKIDSKWVNAYRAARNETFSGKIGDELWSYVYVPWIENWNDIFVKIINKIKERMKNYEK